jgi:hypothetical protein
MNLDVQSCLDHSPVYATVHPENINTKPVSGDLAVLVDVRRYASLWRKL